MNDLLARLDRLHRSTGAPSYKEAAERIRQWEAENERCHAFIDAYCDQPDHTKILNKFNERIAELKQENARVLMMARAFEDDIKRLKSGIRSVMELIDDSEGVYGLHLNGDGAPWDSLRTGGLFEDWLLDFDTAQEAGI